MQVNVRMIGQLEPIAGLRIADTAVRCKKFRLQNLMLIQLLIQLFQLRTARRRRLIFTA